MRRHYIFLLIWLVINLIQAGFTELSDDEAYYWLYGEHLAWGYFHQPPMIGAMIKIGYGIFGNELGVRLITVLLNTASLHLLFSMTDRKKPLLFWAIIAGGFLTHVAGFLAVPDSPLIFFATCFLFLLKRYLVKPSWFLAIVLGVVAGWMLISKYHGILILGFALLANLKLLKNLRFYLIPAVAIFMMLPHIFWQFSHDFPGFGFHLSGRFGDPFDPEFMLNYPIGQLLIAGPLVGWLLWWAAIRKKVMDAFERTLKWIVIGELIWFFAWSLNGRIEPNWTAGAFLGVFLLSYGWLSERPKWTKWFYGLSAVSFLFVMVIRTHLMFPFLPDDGAAAKLREFYGYQQFAETVQAAAGDYPIVTNSYQQASKLWYYTGQPVSTFNLYRSGNEFDLWNPDRNWGLKDVMYLHGDVKTTESRGFITPTGDSTYLTPLHNFPIWKEVKVDLQAEPNDRGFDLKIEIDNPYTYELKTVHGDEWRVVLGRHVYRNGELQSQYDAFLDITTPVIPGTKSALSWPLEAEFEDGGEWHVEVCLVTAGFAWWNGDMVELQVSR